MIRDDATGTAEAHIAWLLLEQTGLRRTRGAVTASRVILALQTLESYEDGWLIDRLDHEAVKRAHETNEAARVPPERRTPVGPTL